MTDLTPQIAAQVAETCNANLAELEAALLRGLDAQLKLSIDQPATVDRDTSPDWLDGAGLILVLTLGQSAALLVIGQGSGILPPWYTAPDATGRSKLATLAQELGMLLLPEQCTPDDSRAVQVDDLHTALTQAGLAADAAMIPIRLETADAKQATAALIWPATKPAAIESPAPAEPPTPTPSRPKAASNPTTPAAKPADSRPHQPATVDNLPPYARSLLRIKVPVVVTLARKRQPLGRVVELGPGSIIQFEKSCEEMLELDVGGRPVATGEAVKVGDKFGLRINAVVLPEERFLPVKSGQSH